MRGIRVPVIVLLLIMLMMIGGCGLDGKDTKVVLTTGFEENEIFRI